MEFQLSRLRFCYIGVVVIEMQKKAKTLDAMDGMEDCHCAIDARAIAESDKARIMAKVLIQFIVVQADIGVCD